MERLTAEDRVLLRPDEIWPQEIGALAVLDGGPLLEPGGRFAIESARVAIGARLHLVPRFRQRLCTPRRGLGAPLWVDAPSFDLADHVHVEAVAAPGDEGDLLRATERLRRRRLDRSRPLWGVWFLTGLPNRRIGMFVKMHHVIADGIAGVATFGVFLDAAAEVPPSSAPPWSPAPPPRSRELLSDTLRQHADQLGDTWSTIARPGAALRRGAASWPAIREIVAQDGVPPTSLNRVVGPDRALALVRSTLDVVRQIADRHDATVNDVLLAATAGGLRGLLGSRGEPVEGLVVPIYVPVTLRATDQRTSARGNLIGQMVVPLPLGGTDPGRRLRQIAAETTERKARRRPSLGAVFRSRTARRVLLRALEHQPVNVTSANLPGPPVPLYLAGARVLEVFPVLPLIGRVSLGVGAMSYAGQFAVLAVADRQACPDIGVFATAFEDELQALARARARLPAAH